VNFQNNSLATNAAGARSQQLGDTLAHKGDKDESKKLGPIILSPPFREWHFIEDAEGVETYQLVKESAPCLTGV
jgi:hypothetical protein